jgi:Tfp pilus assembly protein PilV
MRERGESLLELMISVSILGVAVVALVAGLGTAVIVSDAHRKQATAGAAVRDYAEAVQNFVVGGHYDAGSTPNYSPVAVGYAAPAGFTAAAVSVRCFDGTAWQSCTAVQQGLEQLTVQVSSVDGRATESLVMVLRKRCGLADALCG